jgi:hypothetical protein
MTPQDYSGVFIIMIMRPRPHKWTVRVKKYGTRNITRPA